MLSHLCLQFCLHKVSAVSIFFHYCLNTVMAVSQWSLYVSLHFIYTVSAVSEYFISLYRLYSLISLRTASIQSSIFKLVFVLSLLCRSVAVILYLLTLSTPYISSLLCLSAVVLCMSLETPGHVVLNRAAAIRHTSPAVSFSLSPFSFPFLSQLWAETVSDVVGCKITSQASNTFCFAVCVGGGVSVDGCWLASFAPLLC